MKHIFNVVFLSIAMVGNSQDTIVSQVMDWDLVEKSEIQQMTSGKTKTLESLVISPYQLLGGETSQKFQHDGEESLVIIKEGELTVNLPSGSKSMGPGSVALVMPGESFEIKNNTEAHGSFIVFNYRSRIGMNMDRGTEAGGSIFVDWEDMVYQRTATGGRRQNFDRPTAMFERFEFHTSTLNTGLSNHQVHTHGAEEFVFMLEGDVVMLVGDHLVGANKGDFVFLASEIPHALRNVGAEQTTYFAFQWY